MTLLFPVLRSSVIMDVENLHDDICNSLRSDTFALCYIEDPDLNPRWKLGTDDLLHCDDRIFVPDANDLRLKVLQYKHDHILSGHYGQNKTLKQVHQEYVWPGLRSFVKQFCNSCIKCKQSKAPCHKPYRLLRPLLVLERPWNSISMDFIKHLPPSDGFTVILVIVDRLSKQSIFVPTHDTITSQGLAKLFVIHVFSKHGVPSHVTSD